jgi:hypothetical protein
MRRISIVGASSLFLLLVVAPVSAKIGDSLAETMKVWGRVESINEYRGYPEYRMIGKDGLAVAVVLKDGKTVRIAYYKWPHFEGDPTRGGTHEATRFADEEIQRILRENYAEGWVESKYMMGLYHNEKADLTAYVHYDAFIASAGSPFTDWGLWYVDVQTEDFRTEGSVYDGKWSQPVWKAMREAEEEYDAWLKTQH